MKITFIKSYAQLPRSIQVACVVLGMFYVLSFSNIFLLLVAPTSRASLWASVLFAPDATIHIISAQKNHTTLPRLWIDAVVFFHRENPEIYYQFSIYEQGQGNQIDAEMYMYKADRLAPHQSEYRVALIQYLLDQKKYYAIEKDLGLRGEEGLSFSLMQPLYSAGYDLIVQGDVSAALPFWRVSAKLAPSWSHVRLEYISLLLALGKTDDANKELQQCEKNVYAGPHCQRQKGFLQQHPQQILGRYRSIILGLPATQP